MQVLIRRCDQDNEFKGETIYEYTASPKEGEPDDDI